MSRPTAAHIADLRDKAAKAIGPASWVTALRDALREIDALTADLKRAERAPAVSRDAGEIVDAVLRECGYGAPDERFDAERATVAAGRIVQRALDMAEARGAVEGRTEAADEQRAIERRGGPER